MIVCGGAAITVWRGADEALAPAPGRCTTSPTSATVPFNRPPRPGLPPEPTAFEPPTRKPEPPPARFGIATIVAPLLMAVVMVAVMRNPAYAMLAILSPVLVLGTTVEQRRRRKKDIQENDATFASAFDAFKADLAEAGDTERARRRDLAPDPARTLRRAALPTTTLWQRRADGDRLPDPARRRRQRPVEAAGRPGARSSVPGDDVAQVVADAVLPAAPVEVDLTHAGVVGIVGERGGRPRRGPQPALPGRDPLRPGRPDHRGLLRPGSRGGVDLDRLAPPRPPPRRRLGRPVAVDRADAAASRMLRAMRDGIESFPTPALLLVLDSDVLTEGRDAPARWLLGHGRPMRGRARAAATRDRRSPASSSPRPPSSCRPPAPP